MKHSLNAVTKYVNGIHFISLKIVGCPATMFKFQITGVNHMNNCIAIPKKFPKSGTNVDIADVSLVIAIINVNNDTITYINFIIFGINPYTIHTTVAIINKNIATNELASIDISGITSTGNTTFFTK